MKKIIIVKKTKTKNFIFYKKKKVKENFNKSAIRTIKNHKHIRYLKMKKNIKFN